MTENNKYENPIKEAKEAKDVDLALPLFFNACAETHATLREMSIIQLSLQAAKKDDNQARVDVLSNRLSELKEIHFPNQTSEELAEYLVNYYTFIENFADRTLSNAAFTESLNKIQNNMYEINDKPTSLVYPMLPTVKADMSVRDRMRRHRQSARGSADSFTIRCMNSMVLLRVKQVEPLDMVRLINRISTELNGLGSRFNISSVMLERMGILKIIMSEVYRLTTYHSVSNLTTAEELGSVITYNDASLIAIMLLGAGSPKGVTYNLTCLANKCGYQKVHVVNPYEFIHYYDEEMDEDRKIKFNEMVSKGVKLTKEETLSYHRPYTFDGKLLDGVVTSADGMVKVNIKNPVLEDAFLCLDYHAERINPELRELAIQFPEAKVYRKKRDEYMSCLPGLQYLHLIDSCEFLPPEGVEGESEICTRRENPIDFDKGLMDIFNEDPDFYKQVLEYVNTTAPLMTYTFIGVRNDVCPECHARGEGAVKGFTPIDPVMNFFVHTQGKITQNGQIESLASEILS